MHPDNEGLPSGEESPNSLYVPLICLRRLLPSITGFPNKLVAWYELVGAQKPSGV
jgi:hypothetical protein